MIKEFNKELYLKVNGTNELVQSKIKELKISSIQKGFSIKLCIKGVEYYQINGKDYILTPGSFIFTKPNDFVKISLHSKEEVQGLCIYLDQEFVDKMLESILLSEFVIKQSQNHTFKFYSGKYTLINDKLSVQLKRLISEKSINQDDFYFNISLNIILHQLDINEVIYNSENDNPETIIRLYIKAQIAKHFIVENSRDNLNIDLISNYCGISKYHLIRVFKSIYGYTPISFLNYIRVKKIKDILEINSDLSDFELVQKSGFKDKYTLKKHFLKAYGYNPFVK